MMVADPTELAAQFVEIQTNLNKFANSFYWLDYLSPKRGDSSHRLSLSIVGNTYDGLEAIIEDQFESNSFYSVQPGLYINDNYSHPSGIIDAEIYLSEPLTWGLNTYLSSTGDVPEPPDYSLTADCASAPDMDTDTASDADAGVDTATDTDVAMTMQIEQSETDPSIFVLRSDAVKGATCTVTAEDTANGFTKTVTVTGQGEHYDGPIYTSVK